jgi:hypothetical protein
LKSLLQKGISESAQFAILLQRRDYPGRKLMVRSFELEESGVAARQAEVSENPTSDGARGAFARGERRAVDEALINNCCAWSPGLSGNDCKAMARRPRVTPAGEV